MREADSAAGPVTASGAELGRDDPHVAVPLRTEEGLAGYLVLAVADGVPRSVEQALEASAERLAHRLLDAAASEERPAPELKVVAS